MVILLPEQYDGVEALGATLNPQNLDAWLARLEPENEVDMQLPKFRIESNYTLEGPLIEMGMADAFDPRGADFSGLTGKKHLFVDKAIRKAVVDVEEEGTEAAAATALTFFFLGAPDFTRTPVFRADRPFIFLIRHNSSRTILCLGRVRDPR